jgi:predicted nucleotidyltransferase
LVALPRPIQPPPNYGSCNNEAQALRLVLDRIVAASDPRAIYLFGSRAEGRARPDSDFDLVVVFDDADLDEHVDDAAVCQSLLGLGIGVDVIACRASEFADVLTDHTNQWRQTWANARKVHERRA